MQAKLEAMIGKPLGASDWFLIDQNRINQFADVTEDHQFIHVDKGRARETEFGDTIAHGMLSLSLAAPLVVPFIEPFVEGRTLINYGFGQVRFLAPVKCDGEVRVSSAITGVTEKSEGRLLLNIAATMEIRNEETPAFKAELLILIL